MRSQHFKAWNVTFNVTDFFELRRQIMKHKSLLLISIAFFMFILVSDVSAESNILGWEKAKWGMTQGQVRKIYDIQWSNDGKKRRYTMVKRWEKEMLLESEDRDKEPEIHSIFLVRSRITYWKTLQSISSFNDV
jgi:hypothetical protein